MRIIFDTEMHRSCYSYQCRFEMVNEKNRPNQWKIENLTMCLDETIC